MSESIQKYALNYVLHGWYVIPINHKTKTPLTEHGASDASNNPSQIKKWWTKWPNANVAINTGKSGLVVLDVDPRNGGSKSLEKLKAIHGNEFLSPFEVITGGGGKHYYYSVKENDNRLLPGTLGSGLDLLRGNKYVIAPPSIHSSGKAYSWITNPVDFEAGLNDEEL